MEVQITDAAKKLITDEGYDPTFGARPLKRVIQQRLENPLSDGASGRQIHRRRHNQNRRQTAQFTFEKA